MSGVLDPAKKVANRLGEVDGVAAVALGGSRARGEAHPDSDIDIGIHYHPEDPPSTDALRLLAKELDDRHLPDLVNDLGDWGPWINGGGWLQIENRRVDWLYRDLDRVAETIEECRTGKPTCHYQPGHPHGFHNHMYLGEVHYNRILYDDGELKRLKWLVAEYPPALKRAIIQSKLWEAGFALDTARKSARRGDTFYVAGCAFRCVACLVQVLFTLNERYFVNEKGSIQTVESFARRPERFIETVTDVLGRIGKNADQLDVNIRALEDLVSTVRGLCLEG